MAGKKDILNAAKDCVEDTSVQNYIMKQDEKLGFLHASFTTVFWGFADDFGAKVQKCTTSGSTGFYSVLTQSQLRVGKSDLEVNLNRIKDFYVCLKNKLKTFQSKNDLCI